MADIYSQFKEFKLFEVSFTDNIGKVNQLPCSIYSVEGDIMILLVKNDKNIPKAKVGDLLHLRIFLDSGVYTATSNVLEINENSTDIEYSIDVPTDTKHSQRREYYRTDMPVDIEITISDNDKNDIENVKADTPVDVEIDIHSQNEHTVITGKTKNISGKGMCFVSDKNIEQSDASTISILLKFEERIITTEAKLVYTKEFVNSYGDTIYLHAFSFTNIHQHDIDFIVKKCFLHQLELRKQNYL